MMRNLYPILILVMILPPPCFAATADPAAIGWGNMLVPGLGATLREKPAIGLLEAVTEIGLFYGGTFGAKEGSFTIDSTVLIPTKGSLFRPIMGTILQQAGIKLHMYNTFYHYQQATLELEKVGLAPPREQPLYRGDWVDTLTAPFQWKNLSNPLVISFVLLSAGIFLYSYSTTPVQRVNYKATPSEDALDGFANIGVIPLGSACGEEPLFRGFMQREFTAYTGSWFVGSLMQSAIFALIHPPDRQIISFLGGNFFGMLTHVSKGDLGPGIAAHFWTDVLAGLTTYLVFRRAQGKNTPFNPPLGIRVGFSF